MDQLSRHFWIAFVIITCACAGLRWSHVQGRIRENPDLKPGYRRLFLGHLFWVNLPWLGMGIGILSGQGFPLSSARFGNRVGYFLSLRLEAGPQGLHLAVWPLLRAGHPPLLTPWLDITACEHHGRLFYPVDFRFAKAPTVSVRFSRRTARALLAASGTQVQIQSRL